MKYQHVQKIEGYTLYLERAKEVYWISDKKKDRIGPRKLSDLTLHRDDGPAVIRYDGGECWYQDGLLHREDGPAVTRIEYTGWNQSGEKRNTIVYEYYCRGKQHNLNGPWCYTYNIRKGCIVKTGSWKIHGKQVDQKELDLFVKDVLDGKHYSEWTEEDKMAFVLTFT